MNRRGRRDARAVGAFLATAGFMPDLILASSALRVQQTVWEVRTHSGYEGPVHSLPGLYHAEPAAYVSHLHALGQSPTRVMCVGHNPGLEDFAAELSGRPVRMPTAALAVLDLFIDSWTELGPVGDECRLKIFRVKQIEQASPAGPGPTRAGPDHGT